MSNKEKQIQPLAVQVKNYQNEKVTDFLSQISTYGYRLEKMSNKERQLHTLALQVKNNQDEKIINLS